MHLTLSSHTIQTGLIVLKQVKEFTAVTAAHQSTNKNSSGNEIANRTFYDDNIHVEASTYAH